MKCTAAKKKIPGYILGELSEIEAKSVEKHIEECPDCSEEIERLKRAADAIKSGGATLPPEYYFERFPSRVMERLKESRKGEASKRPERGRLLIPAWAAGAAAVILLAVFFLVNPMRPPVTSDIGETGGVSIVEIYGSGPIDHIDPIVDVSEANGDYGYDTYDTSSYTGDYLDDYSIDEETANNYTYTERYYITEEEFEEILQILKERFLS